MVGRPKKTENHLYEDLSFQTDDGEEKTIQNVQICCPICETPNVGEDGTKQSGNTRIQSYKCYNPECLWLKTHKGHKQFTLFSSLFISMILGKYLSQILQILGKSQGKLCNIADQYQISPSLMTYLNKKFQESIDQHFGLQNLVLNPLNDRSIAIDETFLKIRGKSYYIIIATGYSSHKILGIKVSRTRTWKDIYEVFQEADKNSIEPIEIVTADAWGGTKACVKNTLRSMTLIMHRHKKPYKHVVIERYEYDENIRKVTEIGVKSDFVKKRGKREYYHRYFEENTVPPVKKKRGRPKGVKNGQGKKKKKPTVKKKRGRKGFLSVFTKGKRGYANIDPYRRTVRVGKDISPAVAAALGEVVNLYPKMFIQNNLAENINSVLSRTVVLSGPKTAEGVERRLRALIICRNNPELLETLIINHMFQQSFLIKQIIDSPLLIQTVHR